MTITDIATQGRTDYTNLLQRKETAANADSAGALLEEAGVQHVINQHLDTLGEDPAPEQLIAKAQEFEADAQENRSEHPHDAVYLAAAARLDAYAYRLRAAAERLPA
ncbi:hypothetical protein GCM10023224_05490 [Streptomonospora halophila]|uniref:Uncharacterized protein n=1 Tax=Streptomonospora halophila TaxID=427369 RepID=A0ABP9G8P1_9ACTN